MRVVFVLGVCLVLCCQQGAAWRLWGSQTEEPEVDVPAGPISARETGVDEMAECLRAGREGRCEFYDCLEQRFPCGENGYTNKISKHFCRKIDQAFDTFDRFGMVWLNRTSICLMGDMLDIYRSEIATCAEIRQAGIDGIIECNNGVINDGDTTKNFCDFIGTNRNQYASLMGAEEMSLIRGLGNIEIWRSMIVQGLTCGAEMLSEALSQVGQTVSDFASSVGRSIRNWNPWN